MLKFYPYNSVIVIFYNFYSMFQMFEIIKYNPATTSSCVSMLKFSIQIMCNVSIYIKFTLGVGTRLKKKTNIMFRYNIYKFTTTKLIFIQSVNVQNRQFTLIVTSLRLYRFSVHIQSVKYYPAFLALSSRFFHTWRFIYSHPKKHLLVSQGRQLSIFINSYSTSQI